VPGRLPDNLLQPKWPIEVAVGRLPELHRSMAVHDKHELHVAQTPWFGPSGLRRRPRSTMLHNHEVLAVTNITGLSSEFFLLHYLATSLLPLISNCPSSTILMASLYAMCSCSKMRAARECSSSVSSTGIAFCTMIGPWSSSSSTKCTVHPATFTP